MRFVILFLMAFATEGRGASEYEIAANREITDKKPARAVCKVLGQHGNVGSGVFVELDGARFVLTAKHARDPERVQFIATHTTCKVVTRYEIDPLVSHHVDNDVAVLFLEGDHLLVEPLSISTHKTASRRLSGYGFGYLLEKGWMPFLYHPVSLGTLKKVLFQATLAKPSAWARTKYAGVSGAPLRPDQAVLQLESGHDPTTLQHPSTQGFSGGPLVNDEQEVEGLFHSGTTQHIGKHRLIFLLWPFYETASYNFFPYLSTTWVLENLLGCLHPTLGTAAKVIWGLYNIGNFIEVLANKDTFMYVPRVSSELAVFLPPLLPQLHDIVRRYAAGQQQSRAA